MAAAAGRSYASKALLQGPEQPLGLSLLLQARPRRRGGGERLGRRQGTHRCAAA